MIDLIFDVIYAVSVEQWCIVVVGSLVLGAGGTWGMSRLWNTKWYENHWDIFFFAATIQTAVVAFCLAICLGTGNLEDADLESALKNDKEIEFSLSHKKNEWPRNKKQSYKTFRDFANDYVNLPLCKKFFYTNTVVNTNSDTAKKLYKSLYSKHFKKNKKAPDILISWIRQNNNTNEILKNKLTANELTTLKHFFADWHFSYARKKHAEALKNLPYNTKLISLFAFLAILYGVSKAAYTDIVNPPKLRKRIET